MTRQLWGKKTRAVTVVALGAVLVMLGFAKGNAQEGMASAGVYTAEQAERGKEAYSLDCAACHLDDMLGDGFAPALTGEPFDFRWSDLMVGDMYQAIYATMPQGAPGSLSPQGYVDIISYLLQSNGYPAGDTELPTDEDALQDIAIDAAP